MRAQDGLMIRERAYLAQVCCAICEKQTQFKVANYDPHTTPDALKTVNFYHDVRHFKYGKDLSVYNAIVVTNFVN